MHEKKYAVLCRRRVGKILMLILMLLGLTAAFQCSTQLVHADDDPTSLADVAAHYSNAGMSWLNSKDDYSGKAKDAHVVTPWNTTYGAWNFFGPGKNSILSDNNQGAKEATYSALQDTVDPKARTSVKNAARYSYAMAQTGLDHPIHGQMTIFKHGGRLLVGFITIIMVYMSFLGSNLLHIVFKLFQWVNPFYILQNVVGDNAKITNNIFGDLIKEIQPIYHELSQLSITFLLVSLFIGIALAFMGFRQEGHQEGLGSNIALRVTKKMLQIVSIFIMPVFIGVLSAQLTTELDGAMDVTSDIGLNEVYGNFVGFSSWASHSRLALPNKNTMGGSLRRADQLNVDGNNAFSEDYINAINAYGAGMKTPINIADPTYKTKMSDVTSAVSFLTSYMNGSTINGAAWNATFRARLHNRISNTKGDTLTAKGSSSGSDKTVSKKDALKNPFKAISNDVYGDYGNGGNYDNAMNLQFYKDGSLDTYVPKGIKSYYFKSNAPQKADQSDVAAIGDPSEAGLSSIGLYNYLNIDGSSSNKLNYTIPSKYTSANDLNTHTEVGFVGRGLLAVGSFCKMIVLIATSGLVVAFAGAVIIKGVLTDIPRLWLYVIKLSTGIFKAVVEVLRELVDLYARIVVGEAIVYGFQGLLPEICAKIESILINYMTPKTGTMVLGSINLLPFANVSAEAMGVLRFFEALAVGVIMYAVVRSFRDILRFIDELINNIMESLQRTRLGRAFLPTPQPNSNLGVNADSTNNASNNNNLNPDANMTNMNGMDGNPNEPIDDTPDTGDELRNRQRDPEQNYAHGHMKLGDQLRSQAGLLALDTMADLDKTKAGHALKKGTIAAMGALGGTKLGRTLGMQNRGEGMQAPEKAEQRLKQAIAMATDPLHANNTAKAGMSEAQRKATSAQEKYARQMASTAAIDSAKKAKQNERKAKKAIMDQFKPAGVDAQGRQKAELKDAAKAQDVVDALKAQNALAPEAVAATQQFQDFAKKGYDKAQERTEKLAKEAQAAKEAYAKNPTAENKAKMDHALNRLKASEAVSDPGKRAMLEHAYKKAVMPNGYGLKAATAAQRSTAQARRFTALTGKAAATSTKATATQIKQAQKDAAAAKQVLLNPKATQAQRAQATQILKAANVVTETGRQFGPYATQTATNKLQAASAPELQAARKFQGVDQATIATNMVATDQAPKLSPAESTYVKKLDNARQVLNTGQIMSNGQARLANRRELALANHTLSSDPAKQVNRIQARMLSTTSSVMEQARAYSKQQVAQASPDMGPSELAQMQQQAIVQYMQKPEIQSQLKASGLINTKNPQALQKQFAQIQKMDQNMRQGLNASLEPIRRQLRKTDERPGQGMLRHAGEQQFDRLYASSRLVDRQHYKTTTNKQVRLATQRLLNAYNTKDADQIRDARDKAAAIGMANPIINSQKKLQQTVHTMREQRNNVINNTVYQLGSNSDTFADIQEAMAGYAQVKEA